ncbi:hypothetical protein [Nostoc sp.]
MSKIVTRIRFINAIIAIASGVLSQRKFVNNIGITVLKTFRCE